MSKFYIIGKISRDLAKRMQSDPNADRGAAIKAICDTVGVKFHSYECCLLYTSPSPRDGLLSRMPSSA